MENIEQKELRHIPIAVILPVIKVLQENQAWKQLMAYIPQNLQDDVVNFKPKYTTEHIELIQIAGDKQNRHHAEILFEEWGTSGRIRPKLNDLTKILMNAELFRAADIISVNILKGNPVPRPAKGPAALVDTSLTRLLSERNPNNDNVEGALNNMQYPISIGSANTIDNNLEYKVKKYDFKDKVMLPGDNLSSDIDNNAQSNRIDITEENNIEKVDSNQFIMKTVDIPAFDMLLSTPLQQNNIPNIDETLQSTDIPNFSLINDEDQQQSTSNDVVMPFNLSQLEILGSGPQISFSSGSYSYSESCSQTDESKSNLSSNKSNIMTYESSLNSLKSFKYSILEESTNGFDDNIYIKGNEQSGSKIGSGGSGSVYLAKGLFGYPVAIKKLYSNATGYTNEMLQVQFTSEIKYLTNYQHENILLLLGYSDDGPNPCLIYEYLDGGTLEEAISISQQFYSHERMLVAMGIAKGIEYLHYAYDTSLIHRDIKSANILLTTNRVPKLCDFGLIKEISEQSMTSNIFGTNAYMAPEAFRGNISPKMDVFSYGVVLLELLTGMPARDVKRTKFDIVSYVEEMCPDVITDLVDKRAGNWNQAQNLYVITKQCLSKERERPIIKNVIEMLRALLEK